MDDQEYGNKYTQSNVRLPILKNVYFLKVVFLYSYFYLQALCALMQTSQDLCMLHCIGQITQTGQVTIELVSISIFRSWKNTQKFSTTEVEGGNSRYVAGAQFAQVQTLRETYFAPIDLKEGWYPYCHQKLPSNKEIISNPIQTTFLDLV